MAPANGGRRRRAVHSRIAYFLGVMTTILLLANCFVLVTWNYFLKVRGFPLWEILPPSLSLAFILMTILGRRHAHFGLRFLYRITAICLGILNFSFFAAVLAWILLLITRLLPWPIERATIAYVLIGVIALTTIYGLVNASWLRVTKIKVKLPHLPAAWRGREAVLVSDLHLGNVRGAAFLRRVVARIQKLKPHAVFISGDMFDGTRVDFSQILAPWQGLSVPGGIYYVSGNHEEFSDRNPFLDAVRQTNIRVLDNEKIVVDGLQIVGIHDGETHDPHLYGGYLQDVRLDAARPSILLAHQPSRLAVAAAAGISLQLSGHTHGGQFWPWIYVVSRVHKKFAYGLNRQDKMQVYTTYGAGTWGPPFRVGTKSEIVLIHFEAAKT